MSEIGEQMEAQQLAMITANFPAGGGRMAAPPTSSSSLLAMLLPLRTALLPCSGVSTIDHVYTKNDAQNETSQSQAMRCHGEAKCRSRHGCAHVVRRNLPRCQLR